MRGSGKDVDFELKNLIGNFSLFFAELNAISKNDRTSTTWNPEMRWNHDGKIEHNWD